MCAAAQVSLANRGRILSEEGSHALWYLHGDLLSNMMFNRDFPLGVEDKVLYDPWRFAIEWSGLREVTHQKNKAINLLVWAALLGVVGFGIGCRIYLTLPTSSILLSYLPYLPIIVGTSST